MDTLQEKAWMGKLGSEYTDRNQDEITRKSWFEKHGITRHALNKEFLKHIPKDSRILEVGCNIGNQLSLLQKMGYKDLWGIDIQKDAVEKAKECLPHINIVNGSVFDIPFKDEFFDLVFTSGVLIHISPDDITKALDEIYRCTKSYVWGYEYYTSAGYKMIEWRGKKDLLWKTDFVNLFHDLKCVKQKIIPYAKSDNESMMYLLKKGN